ncbi:MAG: hypothetical protein AAEC10_05030 [Rhodospirillales bacterium]
MGPGFLRRGKRPSSGGERPPTRWGPLQTSPAICGCADTFSAPSALELYAQVLDEEGALDRLKEFASLNGPAFYGLQVNEEMISMNREVTSRPPEVITTEDNILRPFFVSEPLQWVMQGG